MLALKRFQLRCLFFKHLMNYLSAFLQGFVQHFCDFIASHGLVTFKGAIGVSFNDPIAG